MPPHRYYSPPPVPVPAPRQTDSAWVIVLSVISLAVGSVAFMGSFVPCVGGMAIFLAVPGAIAGSVAIVMARRANCGVGLPIAGTVLSCLGAVVAIMQAMLFGGLMTEAKKDMEEARVRRAGLEQKAFEDMSREAKRMGAELERMMPGGGTRNGVGPGGSGGFLPMK